MSCVHVVYKKSHYRNFNLVIDVPVVMIAFSSLLADVHVGSYRMGMLYRQPHLCRDVVPLRRRSLSCIACSLSAPFDPGRNLLIYIVERIKAFELSA